MGDQVYEMVVYIGLYLVGVVQCFQFDYYVVGCGDIVVVVLIYQYGDWWKMCGGKQGV